MAVLQRVAFYPNERFDTPDARSMEGFGLNDWRYFILGAMSSSSYVLHGFDITNYATIFSIAGFKLKVNNVAMFHPESKTQAAGFYVYAGSEPDVAVTLSPNATNFVEADFTVESGVPDVRAFWDQAANPPNGGEFSDTVDTVINLEVKITSNISGFTSGKVPLYKVVTDINGIATSVTDCRNMFFRLGKGGTTPDADHDFSWPALPDAGHSQFETPSTSTGYSSTNAPWQGGDKNLANFKDWMDAVMTALKELKGVPYWYMSGGGAGGIGITGAYQNSALTILQNGIWQHDLATLGNLTLVSGSKIVRLGYANDPILSSFSGVSLVTNPAFYVIMPKGDTAVTFGMGQDGVTPVSPHSITGFTTNSISVGVGGNYKTGAGKIMVRSQEFTYTGYTPGTGLFSGVAPDPSGLCQVGDDVYALDSSGIGYYHYSATSKVPGRTGNISEGAERTIWLAVYNGTDMISIKNGDLVQGEEINVGDNTTINVLEYIGSPSDAAKVPLYSGATATDAISGTSSYGTTLSDNLTYRASKLTQMMADKSQDRNIKFIRNNIDTFVNTSNGGLQDITVTGTSPTITVIMPSSADNGTIDCTGTVSLQANECAYFRVDRNAAFNIAGLNNLTVVAIEDLPLEENVFVFAYRLSTSRVYLYDGRSFFPGSYPGEPSFQMTIMDRLGVAETTFDAYTSTTVVDPDDNYPEAISKLDALVGSLAADTTIEENAYATLNQTAFSFSTLLFSPLNTSYDLKLYRNGRKMGQDSAGTLTEDYRKTGVASVEFAYGLRLNDKVTARMERQINVTLSSQPYFVNYVDNNNLPTISVGNQYNNGTLKLTPFLNGILLYNSNSLGNPADRYQETGSLAITLGSAAALSDVVTFINEDTVPNFKQFVTGLSGTTLTVPSYTMGNNTLRVYRNGVLMNKSGYGFAVDQYTEATSTTITLASAALLADVWAFHSMSVVPDFREELTGLTGSTITLSSPYTIGDERLLVYKNGVLMLNSTTLGTATDRYQETGTTQITLDDPAITADVFTFIYK